MDKMMLRYILMPILLFCNAAHSEVIDGPANFRASPNGRVLASINDGVIVTPADDPEDSQGWHKIKLSIYVRKSDTQTNQDWQSGIGIIKPNSALYNQANMKIGVTTDSVGIEFGPDETEDKYFGVIEAYTFHKNIKPDSLIEAQIENLLKSNNLSMNEGWSNMISNNRYHNWITHKKFTSYIYFNPLGAEIHPEPRVILFFYNESLFAVYHRRHMNSGKFSGHKRVRDAVVHYVSGFNDDITNDFNEFYPQTINLAN